MNEEAPLRGRPIETESPPARDPEAHAKRMAASSPALTGRPVIRVDNVRCEIIDGPKWKNGATGVYQLCLRAIGLRDHKHWASCDDLGLPRVKLMVSKKKALA